MESIKKNLKYYCYIIRSINPKFINLTYNGSTNNLIRRLRQHNGEIVGGACATKNKGPWVYIVIWDGFRNKQEALSCEWRIKHPTNAKKRPSMYNRPEGRIKSLNLLIGLDYWTSKGIGMGICFNSELNENSHLHFNNNEDKLLQYNLFVDENYIEKLEPLNKKINLQIKKLSEFDLALTQFKI